jgi:hypothetical protein
VFRLDSLDAAGVPRVAQVRGRVLAAARAERKKAVARERAAAMAQALAAAPDILAAGRAKGFPVEQVGPFTRVAPPPPLAREPFVLGAAFGLRPGEKTGLLSGEAGYYLLQGIAHARADSAAWLKQRDQQRGALLQPIARARMQQFMAALRAQAKIVDRRKEVFHPTAASSS